jgi:N utilization substance protein A
VHDYQLSLAIGKEGQNARLAARLTGWRIDIKSESELAAEEAGYAGEEWAEGEWVQDPQSGEMVWKGAEGGDTVSVEEWTTGGSDAAEAEAPAPSAEEASPADAPAAEALAEQASADGVTGEEAAAPAAEATPTEESTTEEAPPEAPTAEQVTAEQATAEQATAVAGESGGEA